MSPTSRTSFDNCASDSCLFRASTRSCRCSETTTRLARGQNFVVKQDPCGLQAFLFGLAFRTVNFASKMAICHNQLKSAGAAGGHVIPQAYEHQQGRAGWSSNVIFHPKFGVFWTLIAFYVFGSQGMLVFVNISNVQP